MMSVLQTHIVKGWLLMNCRHLKTCAAVASNYKNKNKKERSKIGDDIYRFNQESLAVFGPIKKRLTTSGAVNASLGKQRNRKPLVEKDQTIDYDNEEAEQFVGDEQVDFSESVQFEEMTNGTKTESSIKHKLKLDKNQIDGLNPSPTGTNQNLDAVNESAQRLSLSKSATSKSAKTSSKIVDAIFGTSFSPSMTELARDINSMSQLIGDVRTPSVTTILNDTMPEESRRLLENWKKRKIAEMGLEAFEIEMDGIKKRGQDLHLCIENTVKGLPVSDLTITPEIEGFWESVQDVLCDVNDLTVTEAKVLHPTLHYGGRLDCIAMYKGNLCLIDWKTSSKKKRKLEYTYDSPIQLAAYAGAVNAMDSFDFKIRQGLLVMTYPDGAPAHAHLMTNNVLEKYWRIWLHRVQLYWKLKQKL